MNNIQFEKRKSIEQVEESNELAPKFDSNGLIPVVTTDFSSGEPVSYTHLTLPTKQAV